MRLTSSDDGFLAESDIRLAGSPGDCGAGERGRASSRTSSHHLSPSGQAGH